MASLFPYFSSILSGEEEVDSKGGRKGRMGKIKREVIEEARDLAQ